MPIVVKLSATLRNLIPDYDAARGIEVDAQTGLTAEKVLSDLNIPDKKAELVFINKRHASLSDSLKDGDTVIFYESIAGG